MATIGMVLGLALSIYMFLFFVRMIMSFVPLLSPGFEPKGAALVLFEGVYTLTDPLIVFFEGLLPPLRIGGVALSLGFIAAYFTLVLLQRLVWVLF